ncbi:hypothetical protein BCR39DRAFT_546280 [Naematelia encephala]|uniref:Uncharacterized protein n=1 Tax=Naematelia encephala TaxID=71784 RepID=A0A1Y2ARV6_9TREE|nr:hypothetical protein BCR39DRAFT_546280 [Naematelia encephala]
MFPSAKRTFQFLLRTPLIPPPPGPATFELRPLSTLTSSGPSRPRAASRSLSTLSVKSGYGTASGYTGVRGYASDHGQKELYSDEAGSTGAGTDDVAHTDAAFNKDSNPESAAKGVEKESGKDFTERSPANSKQSHPVGKQGEKDAEPDLGTSNTEANKK